MRPGGRRAQAPDKKTIISLSKMNQRTVSVVLPAYNEKDNIIPLVREIKAALSGYAKEILVVDDNSPDGTAQAVRREFAGDGEVVVIVRTKDKGFANSIREGLETATGAILVVMDSDFNHQPKYLPFMVSALSTYDCVSGSRFLYGGRMDPRSRHLLSWVFNIFVRFSTGGRITDNLYGYLCIRRDALERCGYDDIFWGYGDYFIRLLYELQLRNAEILQIPMVNGTRRAGVGSRAFLKTFLQYTEATLRLALKSRIQKQPA